MAKRGTSAGGVNTSFSADLSGLEQGISRAKQLVSAGAQDMSRAARVGFNTTGTTAVTGSQDLGAGSAAALRSGNVAAAVQAMYARAANAAEKDLIHRQAVATYQQQTGMTVQDKEQKNFERQYAKQKADDLVNHHQQWTTAQAAFAQEGEAHAENRAAMQRDEEEKAKVAQLAFEQEGEMHAAKRATALRFARMGASAAIFGLDALSRAGAAGRTAFDAASNGYAFSNRSAFNDPTIHAAAGTQAMVASARAGPLGFALENLPIIGAHFSEALERAARSADRLADSHQRAVASIQSSDVSIARLKGEPLTALQKEQAIALNDKKGEWEKAVRNMKDIEGEGSTPGGQFLDATSGIFSRDGHDSKSNREARLASAKKVAGEAGDAYAKLQEKQGLEGKINADIYNSSLANERATGGLFDVRATATRAQTGGRETDSFAYGIAGDELEMKIRQKAELAGKTGPERTAIENKQGRERVAFEADTDEKIRLRAQSPVDATVMSASEAAGPFPDDEKGLRKAVASARSNIPDYFGGPGSESGGGSGGGGGFGGGGDPAQAIDALSTLVGKFMDMVQAGLKMN